jgi:hypothetical protein
MLGRIAIVCLLLTLTGWTQPRSPAEMGREISDLLKEFAALGSRPYQSKWPSGSAKEKLEREKDGTINFTRFFPTGGYAVRYQRKPGKLVKLERYYGNGKTHILVIQDERILDYTSYWENGQKKAKYQRNSQTSKTYYDARDINGKQVYPIPGRPR